MENILVSILIPCYNVEDYIEECVEMIESQTYSNFEIICLDDGSTDSTYSILQDLTTKYDKLIISTQKNAGISQTRKRLVEMANGELSVYIDSDDFLSNKNTLKYMVKKHIKNKRDVTGFNFKPKYDMFSFSAFFKYSILNFIRILIPFIHSNPLNRNWYMWAKIYSTEFLSKAVWNDLNMAEDKQFFIDNPLKIKFYRKKVYRYRVRGNSVMNRKIKNA